MCSPVAINSTKCDTTYIEENSFYFAIKNQRKYNEQGVYKKHKDPNSLMATGTTYNFSHVEEVVVGGGPTSIYLFMGSNLLL
jgi:hypothetical protein